jgi:CelD/BcsL family acetyltransferase involved in cellulose biosynthesis
MRAAADRTQVLALWRALETEWNHSRLTSSSIWVETWLKHYGSRVPHQFLIGFQGDEAIGICLATESEQRFGPLSLRTAHLGTAGEPEADSVCVEFNSLLVRPECHAEFVIEVQRQLERTARCDAVAWDGFDLTDAPAGDNWHVVVKPTCYFDLDAARDDGVEPITRLGDSTRKTIRQNLRDLGKVDVDWSESPRQIDDYYAELIALHQARWQSAGEPGSFASRAFREFHHNLLHRLVPLGRAAMVRVRAGRRTIGCTLLHIEQNRALVYQGGWDSDAAKSPGVVNDYCCLVECQRRGLSAYDFMAGDSIHKRRMTTHQGQLVWATRRLSTWKFDLIDRLRSTKRWLKSLSTSRKESA